MVEERAARADPAGSGQPGVHPDEPTDRGWRARRPVAAVVLVLIGVGAVVAAAGFGVGSLDRPGPGLWPAVLGGALVLSALAFLVLNRDGKEGVLGSEVWNASLVLASVVAFILLFGHVSFLLGSVALLVGTQIAAGARRWWVVALTCAAGTGGAWLLFFVLLGVSTPL